MAKKPAKKSSKKNTKKVVKKSVKKAIAKKTTLTKKSAFGVMPLGDRVMVKPVEDTDVRSPSGIIIPDSSKKEKPSRGKVVAVGEGRRTDDGTLVPLRVSIGDTVMFSKYGFDELTIGDTEYFIVSEASILAIIH